MSNKLQNKEMNNAVVTPERTTSEPTYSPNVDIFETEEEIVLTTELPGVKEEDLDVMLENNILTISAKMNEEKFEDYELIYSEYRPIKFERSFTISDEFDKDKMKATLKNGILNLTIPKAEKAVAKKIKVKTIK